MKKIFLKNNNIKKNLIIAILIFIFPLNLIKAQTVSIETKKEIYNVGDTFLVNVMLNSEGKKINSLGGKVIIPKDLFEIKGIQTKGSFISLWTEKPKINDDKNEITFSGGLLGGYSGSDGLIFSFILEAKNEGDGQIDIEEFIAFLNDGLGTSIDSIKIQSLNNKIKNDPSIPTENYSLEIDSNIPENLIVEISRDPSIENNKYFVSFYSIDKDSGINKYEVEEYPWLISWFGYKKIWSDANNPQVLKYQKWISTIKVRSFDNFGNVAEQKIIKPLNFNYINYIFILLLTSLILFLIKRNKK